MMSSVSHGGVRQTVGEALRPELLRRIGWDLVRLKEELGV